MRKLLAVLGLVLVAALLPDDVGGELLFWFLLFLLAAGVLWLAIRILVFFVEFNEYESNLPQWKQDEIRFRRDEQVRRYYQRRR